MVKAIASEIVAITVIGCINIQLSTSVQHVAVDIEVVSGKVSILFILDVSEEHVAAHANGKSNQPTDYYSKKGKLAFVLPDDQIR